MKRWTFCPVIGAGGPPESVDPQDPENTGPYRMAVSDLANVSSQGVIPTDASGVPLYSFAIGRVAANSNAMNSVKQVSNLYLLPDASLDHVMGSIGADPINDTNSPLFALRQACQARGLSTDFWLMAPGRSWDSFSYREVVLGLFQQQEPAVTDLDAFDVEEP